MITLYKRNAQGKPIFWNIQESIIGGVDVKYGLVGKDGHVEHININRKPSDEIKSLTNAKRKEGYKELKDLYDNAPEYIPGSDLYYYLNNYLPEYNTHENGKNIPMLSKTLEDNKPFERGSYIGQYKINGERCIITATKSKDLFDEVKLHYRSREGVDWTDKLSYMDEKIIPCIKGDILDMMLEEGMELDGEMYIPGYGINEINSFIKNTSLPQHYLLQYWCYDLCIENMVAYKRQDTLFTLYKHIKYVTSKDDHLNNKDTFVILPNVSINNYSEAVNYRDKFIGLGFEGLIIREINAEYQFGGRRNNSMLKFKKKLDGFFEIIAIKEDKRGLPIFTLKNDINSETFDATINVSQTEQRAYLEIKNTLIGKKALVEYRERSGVKDVPFHAKIIKLML